MNKIEKPLQNAGDYALLRPLRTEDVAESAAQRIAS